MAGQLQAAELIHSKDSHSFYVWVKVMHKAFGENKIRLTKDTQKIIARIINP
jgi:hypothetical protein